MERIGLIKAEHEDHKYNVTDHIKFFYLIQHNKGDVKPYVMDENDSVKYVMEYRYWMKRHSIFELLVEYASTGL